MPVAQESLGLHFAMNSQDQPPEFDDLLAGAEAFENSLRQGDCEADAFASQHAELASVIRMLNDAFSPKTPQPPLHLRDKPPGKWPVALARFHVQATLGSGGFGVVYRAFDELLKREVAIKVVSPKQLADSPNLDQLLLEARAAARLNHKNLVPLYEVHQEQGTVYLVSEFCDGPTLSVWLLEHPGPVKPQVAAAMVRSLADAVDHAHSRGIVHRDIKPGNVLLSPASSRELSLGFEPRLTDFGMVRDLNDFRGLGNELPSLAGTIDYMAPEQILGDHLGTPKACDIYALGILLYNLLTGELPFQSDSTVALLQQICAQPAPSLRSKVKCIPRDLEAICQKCLSKHPSDRYLTAGRLVDDLERWIHSRTVLARKSPWHERCLRAVGRAPLVSALAALVLLTASISTLVLLLFNQQLGLQREELRVALRASNLNERRAKSSEQEALAALLETQRQRDRAQAAHRLTVQVAYQADLVRGFDALQQGLVSDSRRIADEVESYATGYVPIGADLRILQALCRRSHRTLTSHIGPVHEIRLIGDDSLVATAGDDGFIRLHDLASGKLVAEHPLDNSTRVTALTCSLDGRQLAVGYSKTIQALDSTSMNIASVVDWKTWEFRTTLTGFPATVESLAFSPDAQQLFVGPRYESIEMCSLNPNRSASIQSVRSFTSDRRNDELCLLDGGRQLVSYCLPKTLRRYATQTGEILEEKTLAYQPHHVASSLDGKWIAVSNFHNPSVELYSAGTLAAPRFVLRNSIGATQSIVFAPTSDRLISGLRNGGIIAWDLHSASNDLAKNAELPLEIEQDFYLSPHTSPVSSIAVSESAEIVSGSDDGTVVVSNLHANVQLVDLGSTRTTCGALSTNANLIYLGAIDGSVWVANLVTRSNEQLIAPRKYPVSKIAGSPSGCWLAVGWEDGELAVVVTNSLQSISVERAVYPLDPLEQSVQDLRFSSDDTRLLCLRGSSLVQSIKLRPLYSEVASSLAFVSPAEPRAMMRQCTAICFVGQPEVMAYGGLSENVRTIDFDQADEKNLIENSGKVSELLYDSQRRAIFCGNNYGQIQRYSEQGEFQVGTVHLALSSVATEGDVEISVLSLSPDGQTLLSGSRDGEVRMWDAETLKNLGTILASNGRGAITDIMFSASGGRLLIHQALAEGVAGQASHLIELETQLSNP